MNKTFKRLLSAMTIIIVGYLGYHQYTTSHKAQLATERRMSPQGQLPDYLIPTRYQLKLRIDPDDGLFSGKVTIEVNLNKNAKELWIHGQDLSIKTAQFITYDQQYIPLEYKEMGKSGVVRLTSPQTIAAQMGRIAISYSGKLADDLAGLYKVVDGDLAYAFSQFQAIDARRAFPSFDEPRFKTPFDIQLEVKNHHQGLTNTRQQHVEDLGDGFKRLSFATTKPLPTYLIAFVVGEVDIINYNDIPPNDIRDTRIPLRGIATKGKGKDLEYALANTAEILNALEAYFAIPYPYDKLDIVAVPDFSAGAMENAGLITYREQLLLLGETPSFSQKRRYAEVHAHELAHQWFGNLVTMPWWDDLWLNESFATWMAYVTMHQWDPSLGFDRNTIRSSHRVMSRDVYADTRQIKEPIKHNGDIENAFDSITYSKGGAILQMFEAYVGKKNFRQGVRDHMKTYAFGVANGDQFLQSITKYAKDKHIKSAFESFLNQNGVPLLTVDYQCRSQQLDINFTQQRYIPTGAHSSAKRQWTLPVCMKLLYEQGATVTHQTECTLITEITNQISLNANCPVAILPNADGKGYWRWSVSAEQFNQLLSQQQHLSAGERYSLASALSAEFKSNRMSASDYLKFIKPFTESNDWNLITQPIKTLEFITNHVADDSQKQPLQQYITRLYQPILQRIGLEPNTEFDKTHPNDAKMLRQKIINLMVLQVKHPELLNQLTKQASQYIGYQTDNQLKPEAIDPELIAIALAAAVIVEGMPFVDALLTHLNASEDGTLRQRILIAIAGSTEPAISEKVLDLITSLSLRVNERITLLSAHMREPQNSQRVYQWFKDNFNLINTFIPKRYISMTPLIASNFCSEIMLQDVSNFFEPKTSNIEGLDRFLSEALERIEICAKTSNYHSQQELIL